MNGQFILDLSLSPPPPPPGIASDSDRNKRWRVELPDEDGEYPRSHDGEVEAVSGAAGETKHEYGREEEGEEEQQRVRWHESALYREAQRHAGAPSACSVQDPPPSGYIWAQGVPGRTRAPARICDTGVGAAA